MLRIIGSTARRMQRLGFLKPVVQSASPQHPSSAVSLGRSLLRLAGRKWATSIGPEMKEYCDRVFTEQHYSSLRAQVREAGDQQPGGQAYVELQDMYLSQDVLPSKRGRVLSEREKDIHVFPTLGVSLGFLTPTTYVLTSRGRLFAKTLSSAELDAFVKPSEVNPLVISREQAVVLLFSFLEADGDLISMLYSSLARRKIFTDYEAGDTIGELLDDYLTEAERSATRMKDRTEISKLKRTNEKIKEWKSKQYIGRGARDEWATLRLEPFVDLGFLAKPDKYAYKYTLTDGGRKFSSCLDTMERLEPFLMDDFVGVTAQLLGMQASPVTDSDQALDSLKESNRHLANNIGYSDITDTALLSAIDLLQKRNAILEIRNSMMILREAQKQNPRNIHFNVDRWGNLKFVSFRKL